MLIIEIVNMFQCYWNQISATAEHNSVTSCDDFSIDLAFSSLSIWLLVFHLEYHCILQYFTRLENCLKMGWNLSARNVVKEKNVIKLPEKMKI